MEKDFTGFNSTKKEKDFECIVEELFIGEKVYF